MTYEEELNSLVHIENICFSEDRISKRSLKRFLDKNQIYAIPNHNTNPTGYKGYLVPIKYKNSIRIYTIATLPMYRGQGVAKALINLVIAVAKNTKKTYVTLECKEDLLFFYVKLGFKIIKEIPNYYENGDKAYKMRIKI